MKPEPLGIKLKAKVALDEDAVLRSELERNLRQELEQSQNFSICLILSLLCIIALSRLISIITLYFLS
jgi:hypothetical protein